MSKTVIIALLLLTFVSCSKNNTNRQQLIVVSLDGFRWDYDQKCNTPTFDSIAHFGVKAEKLKPCYPSVTFPNHYSIATGCYVDKHGIVLNYFNDDELGRYTHKTQEYPYTYDDGRFYDVEPIWITAEKQGIKTIPLYWVGNEAEINGTRPSYWQYFTYGFDYGQRIDTIIKYISLPKNKRADFAMLYFEEPDALGHAEGPDGASLPSMISSLDSLMNVFCKKLNALPNAQNINLIILSDHGMAQLDSTKVVNLDHYFDTSMLIAIEGGNPICNLKIKEGCIDSVYLGLKRCPQVDVWKHGELPERFHYGNNPRTYDITVAAKTGWTQKWSWKNYHYKGAHGYDNENSDMHGIFFAIGPAFKKGYEKETFLNIDIYPLMCKLLGIKKIEDSDGNIKNIEDILK